MAHGAAVTDDRGQAGLGDHPHVTDVVAAFAAMHAGAKALEVIGALLGVFGFLVLGIAVVPADEILTGERDK